MKKLLLFLVAFGLLVPGIGLGDDLFGIASNPYGASRYTETIYGFNNAVETAEESIWFGDDLPTEDAGPLRCFANMNTGTTPTAANLYISSSDEGDAPAGDTTLGVLFTVEALDANWDPITITGVNLGVANAGGTLFKQIGSVTLMRINKVTVTSAAATGDIYIGLDHTTDTAADGVPDTIATDSVAVIDIGQNETAMACYSVPNDYNAFLTEWCISDLGLQGTAATTFRIRASVNGAASTVKTHLNVVEDAEECHTVSPPMYFGEKTDIEFTGLSTDDDATASFSLVLIKHNRQGLGG